MIGFLALFALFFYIALSKMITYLEDVEGNWKACLTFHRADSSHHGAGADCGTQN